MPSTTTSKSSVPTPSTIKTTTADVPTNSPTMPGIVDNCDGFYKVSSGDHCDTIAETYGITTAQLVSWNSEINDSKKALPAHFFSLTTGGSVIFCY